MHRLEGLKREVFYRLLDMSGRVFIHVRPSESVDLGKRRFTEEESRDGIVLVFNEKMRFSWVEGGMEAKLVFGGTAEKCFIPSKDIISIYSPEAGVQFTTEPREEGTEDFEEDPDKAGLHHKAAPSYTRTENLIKVDFRKDKH